MPQRQHEQAWDREWIRQAQQLRYSWQSVFSWGCAGDLNFDYELIDMSAQSSTHHANSPLHPTVVGVCPLFAFVTVYIMMQIKGLGTEI